ncbi:MAG TPA: phosphoribosylformylglycinamidine cyclo-ligase [Acidimicrobiales bacterium]
MGETYAAAGVSINAGDAAVERIKPLVRATYRPEVLGDIGGFGGLFDIAALGMRHPVLVSTTDGVGTKAVVAQAAARYDTIGLDLVAMCVDDLVCQGAQPLFFLDYISVGKLDPDQIERVVAGIADGCRQAGCALIGGEMAEHPGVMKPGELDLVGFAVGVAERDALLTGEAVGPGDVLVGLPSPNLRSNGFSLARRVLFDVAGRSLDDPAWDGATTTVADELLAPSVIYAPAVLAVMREVEVHAVAHVTGGGLAGNLVRVLPEGSAAVVDTSTWEQPRIFDEIQRLGAVEPDEMRRVFNCGIGMVVVVPAAHADAACAAFTEHGHRAVVIGEIVAGARSVTLQ